MDRLDRKILRLLQEDATLAVADVAKKVGLSTTPCWRRIQKLEEDGVIRRRVALLDPVKVNTRVTVFVSIRTNSHSHEWLKRFSEVIQEFPEVVEFYRMSGDVDYLLRVVVPDIAAYDAFYKRLIAKIEIRDVSSSFAMEQIKYTTETAARLHDARQGRTSTPDGTEASAIRAARASRGALSVVSLGSSRTRPCRSSVPSCRRSPASVSAKRQRRRVAAARCACRSSAAPS